MALALSEFTPTLSFMDFSPGFLARRLYQVSFPLDQHVLGIRSRNKKSLTNIFFPHTFYRQVFFKSFPLNPGAPWNQGWLLRLMSHLAYKQPESLNTRTGKVILHIKQGKGNCSQLYWKIANHKALYKRFKIKGNGRAPSTELKNNNKLITTKRNIQGGKRNRNWC